MRCYFHLENDLTFINDAVGIEVDESRQALERALSDVLELLHQAPDYAGWSGWKMKVVDGDGTVHFRVTLGPLPEPLSQIGCGVQTPLAFFGPSGAFSKPDTEERRLAPREKTFTRGRVTFKDRRGGCDCIIEDLSERGARLRVPTGTALPEMVSIYLPVLDRTTDAKVRWLTSDRAGVEFIDEEADSGELAEPKAARSA
jgi:hypothetical protein